MRGTRPGARGGGAGRTVTNIRALLDLIGNTVGDMLYRAAGGWDVLGIGNAWEILRVNAAGTAPEWDTISDLLDNELGNSEGDVAARGNAAWGVVTGGAAGDALCVAGAGPGLEFAPVRRHLAFGGSLSTLGRYYRVNGTHDATEAPVLNDLSETVMVRSAYLRGASANTRAGDNTTDLKVVDDGVAIQTLEMVGAKTRWQSFAVLVDDGSDIAVEYDAGTAPNYGTVLIELGPVRDR